MEIASAFQRRGLLYVLSSPSGAGKSTIARMLMESDDGVAMSVSATTRPIRPGEVDGRDYHFVSDDDVRRDGRRTARSSNGRTSSATATARSRAR